MKRNIKELEQRNEQISQTEPKVTNNQYVQYLTNADSELIKRTSRNIIELTMKDGDVSALSYNKADFHRIFKTYWVKTLPTVLPYLEKFNDDEAVASEANEERFAELVHQLTTFKYLNNSQRIASFFNRMIVGNKSFPFHNLLIFNDLVDFFSSRGDSRMVSRTFQKMEQMGIKPNVMTYNLLGKNYVARTDVVVERLTVWESLLKHMHEQGIKPDLISWYLTLSLLPSDLEHKRVFKLAMIKKGLNKVSKFHDIELTDMLNNDTLMDRMLEYYRSLPRKELDVNCMNTMIYKYLSMNRFADGWMFMTMKNSIRPRNSTLTILLKDCKIRGKLELMIRIINTMRTRYKLINYNSNRMVLDYLLKMPDDGLPEWYPVLVKYMLRYDLSYGIDRYRRLDVMVKRLQFKLDKNFAGHERHGNGILLSTIPLNQVTGFETKFFNNMEKMVVLENESLARIERDFLLIDEDDEIGTDEGLETTDRKSITEEVVSNDQWIRNVILKSYYDLMQECLE